MGYHASGGFCCARLSCKLSERSYLFAELDTHGAEEALVDLCSVGLDIEPIHIRRRLAFDCAKVAAAREFISIDRLQTDRDADLADVDRERNTRDHLVNCICGQIDFDPAEGRALLEECAELSIEQTGVNSSCDIREDIEEGVDHVALELAYQVGDGLQYGQDKAVEVVVFIALLSGKESLSVFLGGYNALKSDALKDGDKLLICAVAVVALIGLIIREIDYVADDEDTVVENIGHRAERNCERVCESLGVAVGEAPIARLKGDICIGVDAVVGLGGFKELRLCACILISSMSKDARFEGFSMVESTWLTLIPLASISASAIYL